MRLRIRQSIFEFITNYFWPIVIGLNVLVLSLTFIPKDFVSLKNLYEWFKRVSFDQNGNFITISTVLIGIYFSLYAYILSADSSSFFAKLNLKQFKRLIRMITNGFFSSMAIVLLSFVNDILYSNFGVVYILLLYILFILIFGSLIEIAIYYSLIFKHDLKSRYDTFENEKVEAEEDRKIKAKLKEFLEKNND